MTVLLADRIGIFYW